MKVSLNDTISKKYVMLAEQYGNYSYEQCERRNTGRALHCVCHVHIIEGTHSVSGKTDCIEKKKKKVKRVFYSCN